MAACDGRMGSLTSANHRPIGSRPDCQGCEVLDFMFPVACQIEASPAYRMLQ